MIKRNVTNYVLISERMILMSQNPVVTIEMEDGSVIKAELYPEIAPNTVNNFLEECSDFAEEAVVTL